MIVPIILCGGSGTRLWPQSRTMQPKQFQSLTGSQSLFQKTVRRAIDAGGGENLKIITQADYRFIVSEQLRQMGVETAQVILEPAPRNTGPAAAAVSGLVANIHGPDALVLLLPADHEITDLAGFSSGVAKGASAAARGSMVVFGIRPTGPHTGYGYIEKGEALDTGAFRVRHFHEKPAGDVAERYAGSGRHSWNSGIYLFPAGTYLEEYAKFDPDSAQAISNSVDATRVDPEYVRLGSEGFSAAREQSIDYAVMERTETGVMVELECDWSDVGSWGSLWSLLPKDQAGMALSGDVIALRSSNCLVQANSRLVTALGVENLVIVETDDAVLIADRSSSEHVRDLVAELESNNREQLKDHRKVARPWGSFDSVDRGERFQVKRITVKPHSKLSLQRHRHRAEHWVVVEGQARVRCDERSFTLEPNESTYIPLGSVHQLENETDEPLHIIEVQTGDYLGEDDIERLEDDYGRD